MKTFIFLLLIPICCFAQQDPETRSNETLIYKAKVISDSGTIKGYFVANTDSSVIISPGKKYVTNTSMNIPVNTIKELQIRNKTGANVLEISVATVLGFILTAGLTKNGGDFDNDGETSFFELLLTAIEGSTSSNRRRRNRALIVGAAGGTAFMIAGFVFSKRLTLSFPLNNRAQFYNEKRSEIYKYTKF